MLDGKAAIVTGASRPNGMGRAAARKLASLGAAVVISDIAEGRHELQVDGRLGLGDRNQLEEAAAEIEAAGGRALPMTVDVTDPGQIQACVERATAELGGIDILFNNAGVFLGARPFFEISPSDWDLSWKVNVMGAVEFCRRVIPSMRERGGGSIVNNSSLAGLGGYPDYAGYAATKFALIGLTKALAAEFGKDGIRVNAVCPGDIETDINPGERAMTSERMGVSASEYDAAALGQIALGRTGRADEVAEVVAFLASPAASYLTGVAVPVAGGLPPGV